MVQRSHELTDIDVIELGNRVAEAFENQDLLERLDRVAWPAQFAVADTVEVDAA